MSEIHRHHNHETVVRLEVVEREVGLMRDRMCAVERHPGLSKPTEHGAGSATGRAYESALSRLEHRVDSLENHDPQSNGTALSLEATRQLQQLRHQLLDECL